MNIYVVCVIVLAQAVGFDSLCSRNFTPYFPCLTCNSDILSQHPVPGNYPPIFAIRSNLDTTIKFSDQSAMSRYPKSRYPWVPCPKPEPTKSVGSTMPPGIRRAGARGEGRGLGMVATCTFPAGSAIAEFSCPLLVFPDEAHVHTMCDWCLRPGFPAGSMSGTLVAGTLSDYLPKVKLSACTGCKYVVYCSKDCQAAAWRSIHKLECPALRNVAGIAGARGKAWSVPTQVRAAVKLLLRLKRGDADVRDAVGEVPFFGSRDASRVEMRKGRLESNKEAFRRYNGGKLWERIKNEARAVMMIAGVMVEGGGIAASAKQEVMNDWVTELLCKVRVTLCALAAIFRTFADSYGTPDSSFKPMRSTLWTLIQMLEAYS